MREPKLGFGETIRFASILLDLFLPLVWMPSVLIFNVFFLKQFFFNVFYVFFLLKQKVWFWIWFRVFTSLYVWIHSSFVRTPLLTLTESQVRKQHYLAS